MFLRGYNSYSSNHAEPVNNKTKNFCKLLVLPMMRLVRLQNGFISAIGAPGAEAFDPVGDSPDESETYGQVPLMQALGVASLPADPDDSGQCEGILIENVAGLPGVIVSAWDTRTFSIFGNLEAGDTVLHSTGPAKSAQVLCKELKKQVVMATLGPDGKQITCMVDGKNGIAQMQAFGFTISITEDGISLEAGVAGITVGPNGIQLRGAIQMGGVAAVPAPACMAVATPATWGILSGLSGPIFPVPNAIGAL